MVSAFPNSSSQDVILETPIITNTIQRFYETSQNRGNDETRSLKKVFLSNRSITCNDGSQAGYVIFLFSSLNHSVRGVKNAFHKTVLITNILLINMFVFCGQPTAKALLITVVPR